MDEKKCPVCGAPDFQEEPWVTRKGKSHKLGKCDICGEFVFADGLKLHNWIHDSRVDSSEIPLLQAWIREHKETKSKPPLLIHTEIDRILLSLPGPSIAEKKERLLQAIGRRSPRLGGPVKLEPKHDYPLAWVADDYEMDYLLKALVDEGQLETTTYDHYFIVSTEGWSAIGHIDNNFLESEQAFVAMWFDHDFQTSTYPSIKRAIQRCGFRPYMVGEDKNEEKIDHRIMANIKKSRFMVADVTGQRNGVYFEAGYAKGLGIPVIWSVRSDQIEDVHFDTRQFPHINWENLENLEEELVAWIETLVGRRSR